MEVQSTHMTRERAAAFLHVQPKSLAKAQTGGVPDLSISTNSLILLEKAWSG